MSYNIQNLAVANQAKVGVPIHTGIGYFDHMLDQLNSHAQVGVGLEVTFGDEGDMNDKNRLSDANQADLCTAVGEELGRALKEQLSYGEVESRFCCPLDEALVECIISKGDGSLLDYTLPPYGIYPKGKGRSKIGSLETNAIKSFWKALAVSSKLNIRFHKVRGDNGHHIVESSFKAFSRALRNFLDKPDIWSPGSDNDKASVALERVGKIERSTKETSISVSLWLNGKSDDTEIDTGIPVLDEFYCLLAKEADMTLKVKCKGDLWVDDHHTAEDVSIAIGQCLNQALGTKAGLNRMWLSVARYEKAEVEVTMDLSNRPCLRHNLHDSLGIQEYVDSDSKSSSCPLSCEMMEHVLDSLVMNSRMTLHIVENQPGSTLYDTIMCTARAFGKALRVCSMVDQRRAGKTASSKGTLSV